MQVKVRMLDPKAVMPRRATEDAAGFDLVGIRKEGSIYSTGLAFEIPSGYAMFIYSRSGHGFKENTRLANAVGVIDADYTGEVKIKLTRDDGLPHLPMAGERIAQAVVMRLPKVEFVEAKELKSTERGDKGFGSTGAQ